MRESRLTASIKPNLVKDAVRNLGKNRTLHVSHSFSIDSNLLQLYRVKCQTLDLDYSDPVNEFIRLWVAESELQESADSEEAPEEEAKDVASVQKQRYFDQVREEWPKRPEQWRQKHVRSITKTYGEEGMEFLRSLEADAK